MDVHLRIVGGFEAGKIVPEENTGNGQNNERGKKYPTLVGAPRSDKPKLAGQLRRRCPLVRLALAELLAVDSLLDFAQPYSFSLHVFSKA